MGTFDSQARRATLRTTNQGAALHLYARLRRKDMFRNEPVSIPTERPRMLLKLAEIQFGKPLDLERIAALRSLPVGMVRAMLKEYAGEFEFVGAGRYAEDGEAVALGDVVEFRPSSKLW